MIEEKQCRRCQLHKPLDFFGVVAASPDGRNRYCRLCARAINQKAQQSRKGKARRGQYQQRPEVIERRRALSREFRQRHSEALREQRKSPAYRAKKNLAYWRRELRKATTKDRRSECMVSIDLYAAEVARLEAAK